MVDEIVDVRVDELEGENRGLSTLLPLSLRLLWRDWQGGELRLLFIALVMAVTSVSGIALFTDRLQQALLLESANMLAADRVLSGSQPAPDEWIEKAKSLGLRTASTLSFTSMVFSDSGNLLVAAKAVSEEYPLRGVMIVAQEPFATGAPIEGGPPPGEAWVESRALSALQINIGDMVSVGEAELKITRISILEPDRQQGGMLENAGPRLMLNLADVPATNVVQPGSRVRYRYLFAGELEQLELFSDWIRQESQGRFRLRDVRDESEEVSDALDKAESFLLLGSLFSVLLAGVAIALTAKRYSERHFDYVAILKTLGCTSTQIIIIYSFIQIILASIAIVVGCLGGWAVHHIILQLLNSIILVDLPSPSMRPFAIGSLTALICLLSFALPPLLALRNTSPLRVLRKDLPDSLGANVPYLFGLSGTIILILWYSQDFVLTFMILVLVLGVVVVLSAISWLLLRSTSSVGMRAGNAWKLAMSATRRRRKQNTLQVMVFSVTIMCLLILTALRTDLIDEWQGQLPEDTPNHFMMNITQTQVDGIRAFFDDNGVTANQFFPMVSASINAINGELPNPRREMEDDNERGTLTDQTGEGDESNISQSDSASATSAGGLEESADPSTGRPRSRVGRRRISWVQELPPDNLITDGSWWDDSVGPGFVSLDEDYAGWLRIGIGDVIEFEVNEEIVTAQVQSLRRVNWGNMQPNFYIIFSPGTFDYLGTTFMSTVLLEREQKILLNDLLRQFPTIVVIEIDAIIEQIQNIIAQVTSAIELIFILVLICGGLVLLSCVNATLDERFYENAILRTLGAGKKLILTSLFIEFAFIGMIAGIMASVGTELSLYYLQKQVFGQDFHLHYWVWISGPIVGMTLIALIGVLSTRRVVSSSPLNVLRNLT